MKRGGGIQPKTRKLRKDSPAAKDTRTLAYFVETLGEDVVTTLVRRAIQAQERRSRRYGCGKEVDDKETTWK